MLLRSGSADCLCTAVHSAWQPLRPSRLQSSGQPRYLSEVHTAHKRDARWLHNRLKDLSKVYGTRIYSGQGDRLTIPLQGSSGSDEQGSGRGASTAGSSGGEGDGIRGRSVLARLLGLVTGQ